MKRILFVVLLSTAVSRAFGQGTVNFLNSSSTLISVTPLRLMPPNSERTYYFGLLTAPAGTRDRTAFTFSGVYGTNLEAAGYLFGGVNVPIVGWTPATARSFFVAGWDASYGHDFNPNWLIFPPGPFGLGFSEIAQGSAGGFNPVDGGTYPALNVFGYGGIENGFALAVVPEPQMYALALAALIVWKRFRRDHPLKPIPPRSCSTVASSER